MLLLLEFLSMVPKNISPQPSSWTYRCQSRAGVCRLQGFVIGKMVKFKNKQKSIGSMNHGNIIIQYRSLEKVVCQSQTPGVGIVQGGYGQGPLVALQEVVTNCSITQKGKAGHGSGCVLVVFSSTLKDLLNPTVVERGHWRAPQPHVWRLGSMPVKLQQFIVPYVLWWYKAEYERTVYKQTILC